MMAPHPSPQSPDTSTTPHPLHRYWALAAAAVQAEALDTALALGLFDALDAPQSAAALADRLNLHTDNTDRLLELLWSMDLLERQSESRPHPLNVHHGAASAADTDTRPTADLYTLTPTALTHLTRAAPLFCGDAWRFRLESLRQQATRLRAHVEQGTDLPSAAFHAGTGAGWAAAARGQIAQEQRAVSVAAAVDILERLPQAREARQLLDLGGGPGWMAMALARRWPQLHGVVCDWPETAAVAQENIDAAGLAGRLSTLGADVASDPIGHGHDLVWCSSVLHFVPDIPAVLAKVFAAMAPGGLFVCVHAERPDDATEAAAVLPYYLPMRLLGRQVLRAGETAQAMAAAGFTVLDSFSSRAFPMAPLQVVVGQKPQAASE